MIRPGGKIVYSEILLTYERSNLSDDMFIKLGTMFNANIDEDFIEDKIFFNCGGKYKKSDYGTGDAYVFRNMINEELLLINTFLVPSDQFEMMQIGIRCLSERADEVKKILIQCFEEERLKPISNNLIAYDNDNLLNLSEKEVIYNADFYNGAGTNLHPIKVRYFQYQPNQLLSDKVGFL